MTTEPPSLIDLLGEYERSLVYTDALYLDLSDDDLRWRPVPESSAIGWHLGHQAAVAHYLVRNLTAAEPPVDASLDRLMDSATAEVDRGAVPGLAELRTYRDTVAERVRYRVSAVDRGEVGAPVQLRSIATTMLTAIVNHEYQHDQWIAEVRSGPLGRALPPRPISALLIELDGYLILG